MPIVSRPSVKRHQHTYLYHFKFKRYLYLLLVVSVPEMCFLSLFPFPSFFFSILSFFLFVFFLFSFLSFIFQNRKTVLGLRNFIPYIALE